MLVGDIYGSDYSKLGLKSTMIASTFGKVFKKQGGKRGTFTPEDISKSLLYAISNNIGQIAYVPPPVLFTRRHGPVRRDVAPNSHRTQSPNVFSVSQLAPP